MILKNFIFSKSNTEFHTCTLSTQDAGYIIYIYKMQSALNIFRVKTINKSWIEDLICFNLIVVW